MNCEEILKVCESIGIKTNSVKEKKGQYIRVLVSADENDADYVIKETTFGFSDEDLPIILAGLKAFASISSFEDLDCLTIEAKTALCNWSNLDCDESDRVSIEDYSFSDDEILTGLIPYSEAGCCCGGERINGCHTLGEVNVSIIDEDGKILDVEFN